MARLVGRGHEDWAAVADHPPARRARPHEHQRVEPPGRRVRADRVTQAGSRSWT
jgi:hypothetical protein